MDGDLQQIHVLLHDEALPGHEPGHIARDPRRSPRLVRREGLGAYQAIGELDRLHRWYFSPIEPRSRPAAGSCR